MKVQIVGTILHVLWNYILVIKFGLGVMGTGLSACITNMFILVGNIKMTQS
jgi:Na+-driven multidrug efflux pump